MAIATKNWRAGIPALIDGIRLWHPDIAVGGASCYLQEDFYNNEVALDGEADKDVFVGVFMHDDDLVGMWSWEQVPDTLSLYGRLIVVAPAINPAGFIPAIQDGDVTMVESIAIMEYLMARYGPTPLAPDPHDPAFPAYRQFLHLGEAGLAASIYFVNGARNIAPEAEESYVARTSGRDAYKRAMDACKATKAWVAKMAASHNARL